MLFRKLDLGPPDDPRAADRKDVVEVLTSAIRGSDAYAAVRRAVRLEEGVLRVGNRFLRRSKVEEVAFLAVGNCASAMAHGFHDALGEVVTQGLVAGPAPPPDPWPFLFRKVVDPTFPSIEGAAVAAEALEMAEGLSEKDLFVPLFSPGSLGMLGSAPPGWNFPEYTELLRTLGATPSAAEELPVVAAALSPVQGGGLASAARKVRTEALIVDRGDGARSLGAGPTVPRAADVPQRARAVLEREGLLARLPARTQDELTPSGGAPRPVGSDLHNVVVASPGDALETSGAEAGFRKHLPRLVELHDLSPPEQAADRLVGALEQHAPHRPPKEKEGIAVFSGLSLGAPEGGESKELFVRFLARAQQGLQRRETTIALLYTGGSLREANTPSGALLDGRGGFDPKKFRPGAMGVLDLTPGFTDVGTVALAYLSGPAGGGRR